MTHEKCKVKVLGGDIKDKYPGSNVKEKGHTAARAWREPLCTKANSSPGASHTLHADDE